MKAIAIATVTGKCLPVLCASISAYVPKDVVVYIAGSDLQLPTHKTVNFTNPFDNFGDAYNFIVTEAFKHHDEIVVANDDVVLDPTTWQKINEDVVQLKKSNRVGWVSAKSNRVRPSQQYWMSAEDSCFEVATMSPLCSYISKQAWVDFPPINWFSDDVQCIDVRHRGYKHFVSRGYVHHVGSSTIGQDNNKNASDAEPWIKQYRPELHQLWFQQQ